MRTVRHPDAGVALTAPPLLAEDGGGELETGLGLAAARRTHEQVCMRDLPRLDRMF